MVVSVMRTTSLDSLKNINQNPIATYPSFFINFSICCCKNPYFNMFRKRLSLDKIKSMCLTLVLLRVFFFQTYFPKGDVVVATSPPPRIFNTENHISLILLPVYRCGHPFSIDTKISTTH